MKRGRPRQGAKIKKTFSARIDPDAQKIILQRFGKMQFFIDYVSEPFKPVKKDTPSDI
jgi:hypothetical protein